MGAVEVRLAYADIDDIRQLFAEYVEMLIENDADFAAYLALQRYDAELTHLADKYGLPDGRLYIAYVEGQAAGCIGLRKLDAERCEMKRLYARPAYRGRGIAHKLIEQLIADAKRIGYRAMLLDTLPFLSGAIRLYRAWGFYETAPYNDSPMRTSIFMRLDL